MRSSLVTTIHTQADDFQVAMEAGESLMTRKVLLAMGCATTYVEQLDRAKFK